ncbi:MAG: dTDP-4-dehydrorhamnose 3,5-epimerase [Deltaproteobacteria bacterium]|jgi:dTDP-4-dehydrorhamnose 3,5-epimerase|nr:dTDP-4-dehydrorhamnose 3,5-epimerase [Deltaproteobacteria bacterium]
MKFIPLPLAGAFRIDCHGAQDSRGSFERTFCEREFAGAGIDFRIVQSNVSRNVKRGTLRGMHYQAAPHAEAKLLWCSHGSVYDVLVDLRKTSPTFLRWCSVELHGSTSEVLFAPAGIAHGYVTLADDTELVYLMSNFYEPSAARGVRWNDPTLNIAWPVTNPILSEKDAGYPDFDPKAAE